MTPREFAVEVVQSLRRAGFEALWAGGCVRDEQMGLVPKDYDVATSARPEQVREVLGRARTLPVGAAFGVVLVVGPKSAGNIDVATFRRDAGYSDGRRPDSVTYSSAAEDAARRDFTINGLFFDPLTGRVIDYVDGLADLQRRVIRAIGDPHQRIAEDKLRMLRGIRFAAQFEFELDAACLAAIRDHAHEIWQVSVERIVGELRLMLRGTHRARAARLLAESRLLPQLLPEGRTAWSWSDAEEPPQGAWAQTLRMLESLGPQATPSVALALLLRPVCGVVAREPLAVSELAQRWRLTNDESAILAHLLEHEGHILRARSLPWPQLQRLLVLEHQDELLQYAQVVASVENRGQDDLAYCRERLAAPAAVWNPPQLISGNDLKALGIPAGPAYRRILNAVRDAQLEGQIDHRADALELARRLHAEEQG